MQGQKMDVIKIKRHDKELITCELITITDELQELYKHCECGTIDIVCRKFGGRLFDVVCDDEALLKEDVGLPTSWWQDEEEHKEGLFGVLLLCHNDGNGELTSATYSDLLAVHKSFRDVLTSDGERIVLLFHDLP